MGWRPVQGIPRLLPESSWDRLQFPSDPSKIWIDGYFITANPIQLIRWHPWASKCSTKSCYATFSKVHPKISPNSHFMMLFNALSTECINKGVSFNQKKKKIHLLMISIPFSTSPFGQTCIYTWHTFTFVTFCSQHLPYCSGLQGFKNLCVALPKGNIFDVSIKMQHRTTTNKTRQGRASWPPNSVINLVKGT